MSEYNPRTKPPKVESHRTKVPYGGRSKGPNLLLILFGIVVIIAIGVAVFTLMEPSSSSIKNSTTNSSLVISNNTTSYLNNQTNSTSISNSSAMAGVAISVDYNSMKVSSGQIGVYIITVNNTGNSKDTYTIGTTGGTLDSDTVTIGANSYAKVALSVPGSETGKYTYVVSVVSTNDPTKTASVSMTTTVAPIAGVSMTANPLTDNISIYSTAVYTITVINNGNADDTFSLSVVGDGTLSSGSINLEPNSSGTVTLSVYASSGGSYTSTVSAVSQNDNSKSAAIQVITNVPYPYGASVSTSASSATVGPGTSAVYNIMISNIGSSEDTYTLVLNGNGSLGTSSITLPSGSSTNTTLTVNEPSTGTYTSTVNITSTGNSSLVSTLTFTTTVSAYYGVSISANATSSIVGVNSDALYLITITNTGDAQDSYNLTLGGNNSFGGGAIILSASSITLPAGASAGMTLTVSSPTPGNFTSEVTAVSNNNPSQNATLEFVTNVTTSVQPPYYVVSANVNQTAANVSLGSSALYSITINNLGNTQDTYNLTSNDSNAVLNTNSYTIPARSSGIVLLNVTESSVGVYNSSVTINSTANSSESAVVTVLTTVNNPIVNLSISASPLSETVASGSGAVYLLNISNTGSIADTYTITSNDSTAAHLNQSTLYLAPGNSGDVSLTANELSAGNYSYVINATSIYNASTSASASVQLTVD